MKFDEKPYLKADLKQRSKDYFATEEPSKRGQAFASLLLALGFQALRIKAIPIRRVLKLLGEPDFACGDPKDGVLAYFTHSRRNRPFWVFYLDIERRRAVGFHSNKYTVKNVQFINPKTKRKKCIKFVNLMKPFKKSDFANLL